MFNVTHKKNEIKQINKQQNKKYSENSKYLIKENESCEYMFCTIYKDRIWVSNV